eukprot:11378394-Alexandrium_andersonii.AAC.1
MARLHTRALACRARAQYTSSPVCSRTQITCTRMRATPSKHSGTLLILCQYTLGFSLCAAERS